MTTTGSTGEVRGRERVTGADVVGKEQNGGRGSDQCWDLVRKVRGRERVRSADVVGKVKNGKCWNLVGKVRGRERG